MKHYLLFLMLFAFANQTFAQNPPPPPPPPPRPLDYLSDPPPPNVQDEPDVNKVTIFEVAPNPLNMEEVMKKIGYPPIAKEAGIEGQVMLRILVDEKGNYVRHIISKAAHPLLQAEVEKHAQELYFTPAIQDGKPIKSWVNIPFNFKLEEETKKEKKRWGRK
jgi:periplasmic protein TonB